MQAAAKVGGVKGRFIQMVFKTKRKMEDFGLSDPVSFVAKLGKSTEEDQQIVRDILSKESLQREQQN